MGQWGRRFLVYAATGALCGMTAIVAGAAAGIWSFLQIVAVIELIYWIASPPAVKAARDW